LTGSLQIKNDMFYAVINSKDIQGKRKQKWIALNMEARGNKRKAQDKLNEILLEYEETIEGIQRNNEVIDLPEDKLFCDWMKEWVEIRKDDIQITTYDGYIHMINKHIYPYFNKLKITLSRLRAEDIQHYYNEKLLELSSNSVHKHHEVIHSALKYAVKKELVSRNVADYIINIPKKERKQIKFYTGNEIDDLIKKVKNTSIETPIILLIWFGLRRSEVLGLKWDVVDFERGTLTIDNKVVRAKVDGKIQSVSSKELKTVFSRRTFKLTESMIEYLRAIKQKQKMNMKKYGSLYNKEYVEYICVNEKGDLIKPDYLSHTFQKIILKNGLKRITLHGLRHSTASYLLDKGFRMKELQEYLGHSNYQTTADIYSHINPETKSKMVDVMADKFAI